MITMWTTKDIQHMILALLHYEGMPEEDAERLTVDLAKMNDECNPMNDYTRIVKTED